MKRLIVLAGAGVLILTLTACGHENGWDAIPVEGKPGCFQITEWSTPNGRTTDSIALGVYCKAKIIPQGQP